MPWEGSEGSETGGGAKQGLPGKSVWRPLWAARLGGQWPGGLAALWGPAQVQGVAGWGSCSGKGAGGPRAVRFDAGASLLLWGLCSL